MIDDYAQERWPQERIVFVNITARSIGLRMILVSAISESHPVLSWLEPYIHVRHTHAVLACSMVGRVAWWTSNTACGHTHPPTSASTCLGERHSNAQITIACDDRASLEASILLLLLLPLRSVPPRLLQLPLLTSRHQTVTLLIQSIE